MKPLFLISAAAAVLAAAPAAISQTRTITVDTPNYYGERVVTRDRDAGLTTRNSTVTRKADNAVATSNWERQRTDTGALLSGSQTNFRGQTRTFEGERQRGNGRYRTRGTITRPNGNEFDYRAQGRRTQNGWVRRQRVRNSEGETVARRNVRVRRDGNTVTRRVTSGRRGHGVRRTTTRRTVRRRGR